MKPLFEIPRKAVVAARLTRPLYRENRIATKVLTVFPFGLHSINIRLRSKRRFAPETENPQSDAVECDIQADFLVLGVQGEFMNPAVIIKERVENDFMKKSVTGIRRALGRPTVLIATIDPEIREALAGLLEIACVNAIWVSGVKDVKAVVAGERIVACLCGFWLQDGTYREVIRHLRRERIDIPAIIVSAPACPHEYRDYLAAMNLGALDFLCYPYQQSDFEKMLGTAIASHSQLRYQRGAA